MSRSRIVVVAALAVLVGCGLLRSWLPASRSSQRDPGALGHTPGSGPQDTSQLPGQGTKRASGSGDRRVVGPPTRSDHPTGELRYDPERQKVDADYAAEVYRYLLLKDSREILAHPDFKQAASEVNALLKERFGEEAALAQLRTTYGELAGIGQFSDNLQELEEAHRKSLGQPVGKWGSDEGVYLAKKEFYTAARAKLLAAATGRLRFELNVDDEEFFARLFRIKPEMGLPPLDTRLQPGQLLSHDTE